MASTQPLSRSSDAGPSQARTSPRLIDKPRPSRVQTFNNSRSLNLFSPVNENGSFEFDRVIKSGVVQRRTRKTKTWKPIYLVLRPHTLSLYKDPEGTKLRHQLKLSDITAVARQSDPKARAQHVFRVFSPASTLHLSAPSETDAADWVAIIRDEARIDEDEDELEMCYSPTEDADPHSAFGGWSMAGAMEQGRTPLGVQHPSAMVSSSSEHDGTPIPSRMPGGFHSAARKASAAQCRQHALGASYSGNDLSVSDLSDLGVPIRQDATVSVGSGTDIRSPPPRAFSSTSLQGPPVADGSDDRIIYQGWLHLLKTKGAIRQWKRLWTVLRPKNCAFYKSEDEYAAVLILPLSSLISAMEIDPVSKNRPYCMQLIAEDRHYRFAAPSEEKLSAWLGAFLSLFAKRKQEWRRETQAESAPVERTADASRARRMTAEGKKSVPARLEAVGDDQAPNRQSKAHHSMSTIASSNVGAEESAPVAGSAEGPSSHLKASLS